MALQIGLWVLTFFFLYGEIKNNEPNELNGPN